MLWFQNLKHSCFYTFSVRIFVPRLCDFGHSQLLRLPILCIMSAHPKLRYKHAFTQLNGMPNIRPGQWYTMSNFRQKILNLDVSVFLGILKCLNPKMPKFCNLYLQKIRFLAQSGAVIQFYSHYGPGFKKLRQFFFSLPNLVGQLSECSKMHTCHVSIHEYTIVQNSQWFSICGVHGVASLPGSILD